MDESRLTDITHLLGESGALPTRCEPDANGWVPHGRCIAYRDNGILLLEISYDRGIAHGPYRDLWSNGRVSLEGRYVNGWQEGEWRFYDHDTGELRERLHFVAGREIVDWDEFFRAARSEN
jgi:antitoxin component YwqK of YwqJK toxin-antitoxin module